MSQKRADIFRLSLFELSERNVCDGALASAAMTLAHYVAAISTDMTRNIVLGEVEEAISADA